MKLQVERDALADAVTWAVRTLDPRPTNPVLAGLLMEAGDDRVTLSSSDQVVSSRVSLDAEVGEPGTAIIPGRLLAEIAKVLPGRPVELSQEGSRIVLQCGRARFTVPTLPVADYPALPALPPVIGSCAGHTFSDAVAQVAIAAGAEDGLSVLTGIRTEFGPDAITMAATDRFRLAERRFPWQASWSGDSQAVVLRARTLLDLSRPFAGVDSVDISLDEDLSVVGFTGGSRRSTSPVLEGSYPDLSGLLERARSASSLVTMSTGELIESVKRVRLVVDRPHVPMQLEIADGEVRLRATSSEDAGASDVLECQLQGDPLTIAFNPAYLLDGLAAVPGPTVQLAASGDPRIPALISAPGEDVDYRYLLMSMKLPN